MHVLRINTKDIMPLTREYAYHNLTGLREQLDKVARLEPDRALHPRQDVLDEIRQELIDEAMKGE